jgi:hypothetical protein
MVGQWIGEYKGKYLGLAVLNLEIHGDRYEGHVGLFDYNQANVWLVAKVSDVEMSDYTINATLRHFAVVDKNTSHIDSVDKLFQENPTRSLPSQGRVTACIKNGQMDGNWETDIGMIGYFKLELSDLEAESPFHVDSMPWSEYRKFAASLSCDRFIFRGQRTAERLSTSFHRTGRVDLVRYADCDVPELQRYISSLTNYYYDKQDPVEYAALLNLAQHHGYPTPLLDWTESPYIAAYFAYATGYEIKKEELKPRIYVLDKLAWDAEMRTNINLWNPQPILNIIQPLAIGNNRALPQQSVTTVSSVVDIEKLIHIYQIMKPDREYLKIIQLDVADRPLVMKDLRYMGITAASLFPGFEGTCRALKEKHFK